MADLVESIDDSIGVTGKAFQGIDEASKPRCATGVR